MDTRARIVDSARQLFWEQGYNGTSLAQIASASGANTGSIYYFFKTKDAILDAVVEHYAAELSQWLVAPVFAATEDPLGRVFGIVDSYRTFLVETHFSLGCPVGGLAIELPAEMTAAREQIGAIFADLQATLAECLEQALGADPPGPDAHLLSSLVMTVIEGGIVQARAAQSIEPFDQSVACLRDYLLRLGSSTPPLPIRPLR